MDEKTLAREFGVLIRRLRLERAYSQESFGEASGLHRTYIGMVERGETNATLAAVNKMAKALGITLGDMFSELERASRDNTDAK
jgi:transcriptional regulator with XRE-family HTH domain